MNQTREAWQSRTKALLPPRERIVDRNVAITAFYARWYTDTPSLFKWAGMAVFGSHRAGRYLSTLVDVKRWTGTGGMLEPQLELIRRTNNDIFDDLGWAHVAYQDPSGGLAAVREGLADLLPRYDALLDGFERIDRARLLSRDDPAAAARLAWEGNRLLLKHEQEVTVQPLFASFKPWFRQFFSVTAWGDFDLDFGRVEPRTLTTFYPYMLVHGRSVLRESGRLPDVTVFAQRWFWIDNHSLPAWRRADARPSLRAKIRELAAK